MILILIAGYMESRFLLSAAFIEEVDIHYDGFIGVTCNPEHDEVLCCHRSSTSKHFEPW